MRRAIFGGLVFVGGVIMFSAGAMATVLAEQQASYVDKLEIIGVLLALMGFLIGIHGVNWSSN